MNNEIRLGYQAVVVSMKSLTYGRVGLSTVQRPGNTVSCTQAEALVIATESRIGCRPIRRTDLLADRIQALSSQQELLLEKVAQARRSVAQKQANLVVVSGQIREAEHKAQELQEEYTRRQIPERPHSKLAKAKKQVEVYKRRYTRYQKAVTKAQKWLIRQQERLTTHENELKHLQLRLEIFQKDNLTNIAPLLATFRLDAGFGTAENIALLIELGYELYTKPHGNWLSGELRNRTANIDSWEKVGKNAEMVAWKHIRLDGCPYSLDLACERFWTGKNYRFSGLIHFGQNKVTDDLPSWFRYYNARQTIEAGNKEARQVFETHHLKVRSLPALQLQERFALFAANFVRFATLWLTEQCPQLPDGWKDCTQPRIKQQVKVGANTSAWVSWIGQDCLLRFTDLSVFAGRSLRVQRVWVFQPVLPLMKSCFF